MRLTIAIGLAATLVLPIAASADDPAPARVVAQTADIDIVDLLERYAKRTGTQIIIDPRVRTPVQLAGMDPDRIDYPRLLAILAVHQFAAVKQGDWMLVEVDANARQLPTAVYAERNFKANAPDELVTLVTTVRNICAAQAVPVLRPLMPQAAHMAASVDTNTLILSDHAANVHRLVAVIEALERAGEKNPDTAAQCRDRFESKTSSGK